MKQIHKYYSSLALLALLLIAWPRLSLATSQLEQIGKIVALRGKVTASSPNGSIRELSITSAIFLNDLIKTSKTGRAQILFDDLGIISLGMSTDFIVSKFLWQEGSKDIGMKAKVKEGVFRIIGGLITKNKPDSVQIKTPSATIGIRGSMYSARVRGEQLDVLFEGGKGISLQNDKGIIIIGKAGFGSQVTGRNTPLQPATEYSTGQINNITKGITGNIGNNLEEQSPAKTKSLKHPPLFSRQDIDKLLPGKNTNNAPTSRPETAKDTALLPDKAKDALIEAINEGMSAEAAMESILRELKNPDRQTFNQLVNEAIDQGLNAQQASDIVKRLKESGVCK